MLCLSNSTRWAADQEPSTQSLSLPDSLSDSGETQAMSPVQSTPGPVQPRTRAQGLQHSQSLTL